MIFCFVLFCFPPSQLHSPAHLQAVRFVDSITTEGSAAFHSVLAGGGGEADLLTASVPNQNSAAPFASVMERAARQ